MEPANRVLVLRATNEPFEKVPYVIHLLMDEWRRRGIPVEVTDSIPEPTGPDVLVFPHMDLTIIPPRLAERLGRCARVINRSVTDISKRRISRHLVAAPDDHDGPVIVKTNLNFGGKPEMRLVALRGGEPLQKLEAIRRMPWPVSGILKAENYPIYENPRLVPPRVWGNPRLIVEKFLPEMEGEFFCLRQYIFFGESEINTRSISPDPRVKSRRVARREILDSTPPAVRSVRDELGFDYGKFDYVVRGGEAVVFDVNRTFSYDPESKTGSASTMILKLADGIQPFLDGER
jgi:hypothetical protein